MLFFLICRLISFVVRLIFLFRSNHKIYELVLKNRGIRNSDFFCSIEKKLTFFSSNNDPSLASKSVDAQLVALVDFSKIYAYMPVGNLVCVEAMHTVQTLVERDSTNPLIVVSAHFLGIELFFSKLARLPPLKKSVLLVTPPSQDMVTWKLISQRFGKKVLRADHAMTEGLQLLRKGGTLGFLVSAPHPPHKAKLEFCGPSLASTYSTIDLLQARYLAGAARTAQVLARRTGARILWATSRQVEPGRYVGHLQEVQLQDLGETEESAQMYFAGLIKAHLQEHGLHQMAWAALGPPPEIPATQLNPA